MVKHKCGTCNKSAAKNSILCNFCNLWHHATPECMVTFTKEQIDMLKELCKERTCWTCNKCSLIMKKLNGRMAALEKDLADVKKDITEVKDKQTNSDKALETVEKDVQTLKQKVDSGTSNTKASVMSEVNQREMRKNNLIIHGLQESDLQGAASRDVIVAEETVNLNGLLTSMSLNATEISKTIKFRKRLGEKKPNKPRPLLLGFNNSGKRNLVMETANGAKLPNLGFKSDLTKMQREENSKLISEVQDLNKKRPSDDSGDYRWKLVGPPEMLRKAKVRDITKWEEEEANRYRKQKLRIRTTAKKDNVPLSMVEEEKEGEEEE